ncbi:MAG TPA: TonB-dependent receptor [Pyrinomonadaceae bacterium]|jgi:iron complex outermembrane receptor protein
MKIVKILSLICFLTIGIRAQNGYIGIEGKVTDAQGESISAAEVTITSETDKDFRKTTRTDGEGYYRVSVTTPGFYILTASYSVNGEVKTSAPVKGSAILGKYTTSNLQITGGEAIREEVTVIAAGTRQTIDEVSKTVNIIDGEEMRARADFALTETLRTIPGFRVQQLGGFGRTASIKTRGLRNQDTAILIDGIRFRDASAITGDASAFLSDFTLTSVSRIEVLRGSGSSLYGTNAIGGTIDFQTPKPEPGLHGQISGAFGGLGLGRLRGNISDGTRDGKFGFNLGVSRTVYAKGIDGEDDARNANFQSRVEYNPFEKTNVSGRFFVSDAFVRLNSNPDTLGALPATNAVIIDANPNVNFVSDANDPDNFQKSNFFSGQFAVTQIISNKLFFQGSYQGLKTSRKNTNGVLGVPFQPFGGDETSIFEGLIQTANARFNWTPNRAHEITFGYEYEREKFGNDGFTADGSGNFSTRARQASSTFYAQDLLRFFNNRLQIAGGFRAQFFNLENPAFSAANAPYSNLTLENPPTAYTFDGAASYFFAETGTKIRAHAGNGYRVPSLYERFGTFYSSFSQDFIALGDPNLKPERSIAFDGGIEQNLFEQRVKLTAVYFYTKLIDTIGFGNVAPNIGTTPRPFGGYINTKGGIARGAEFASQIKATGATDIFASYTFTNSDQRAPQVAGSRIIETLGIPKHQFTLTATQRFKRAWVNFDFLAASDYLAPIFSNATFNTYVYRFGGNRRADLTAGYTFPLKGEKLNLRVFGTIENLFDEDYYENGFRTVGRTARAGLALSF